MTFEEAAAVSRIRAPLEGRPKSRRLDALER